MRKWFGYLLLVILSLSVVASCTQPTPTPSPTPPPKATVQTTTPAPGEISKPTLKPTPKPTVAETKPPAGPPYFEGKTIEIVAATAAGGGTDTTARVVAAYLPKYIPGNPKTIVRNQPGAGGVIAANSFYEKAKPDGLTLLHGSATLIANQQRQREIVKYDLLKLPMVGNIGEPGPVVAIRKDAVKKLTDLNGPAVVVGTRSGEETWEVVPIFGREFLGWNIRWLPGFGGTGEIVLAFRRGEVDFFGDSQNVKMVVNEGIADAMAQLGIYKSGKFSSRPDFPNVPVFPEMMGNKKPTGIAWEAYLSAIAPGMVFKFTCAPRGTPDNIVNILVDAYTKMAKDPQFNDMLKKSFAEEYDINTGKDTQDLLKAALDVSPEAIAYIDGLFKKFGLAQ